VEHEPSQQEASPAKATPRSRIGVLVQFIRGRLISEYTKLQARLRMLKQELIHLEEKEIAQLVEDYEGDDKTVKNSFLVVMTMYVGEARALEIMKKHPIIRQRDLFNLDNIESLDYETLNRVALIYNSYTNNERKSTKLI
jgi:hypothetical protein